MIRAFCLWFSNWVTCPVDAMFAACMPAVMAAMCVCAHLSMIATLAVAVGVHLTFMGIYMILRKYGYVIDEDAPDLSRERYGHDLKRP